MNSAAEKSWFTMTPPQRSALPVLTSPSGVDFESFFKLQWEPLCRTLYRLLGDWDEAEDLALESFLRLYNRPPKDPSNLTAWLYRVATNLGLNALRARKRRLRYEDRAGKNDLEDHAPSDPAQDFEQKMDQHRVRVALQSMKPRSALILLLRYSGLTYAEIAVTMQIAPGSVGTLLARAEKEFEKAFTAYEEVEG